MLRTVVLTNRETNIVRDVLQVLVMRTMSQWEFCNAIKI